MPYYIGGLVDDVSSLVARTPEQFRDQGIEVHTRHNVESIDVERRDVTVRNLDTGDVRREPFDQLVIATGAEAVRPDLPNIDTDGIYEMSWMHDMEAVERDLANHDVKRAVVVGGGYIGIEMAEAFHLRGISTTLIHSGETLMANLDENMGELINAALIDAGIKLVTGQRASGFETGAGRVRGVVTDDASYPADIVVLGIGTQPRSRLAQEAGIPTGVSGGIIVDERMRTPIDGIWAAGDCTEMLHLVSGEAVSIALGTIANKQGRVCGINLGGGEATFPGVLGTAITKFLDTEIARTGLCERELRRLDMDYVAGRIESSTKSGYYPGSSKMTVKLTAERESGRIVGGQIVGGPGSGKRIDTIVTALASGMTLLELEYLDLSYAPPFSPVWDPVQIAARITNQQR